MQIQAILFDIDGTLVDTNDLHVLAWQEAFTGIGAHFDRQTIHDQIGKGADMLVPTLLPGLDEEAQQRLGARHDEIFKAKYLDGAKPFPCAHDLLARAHAAGQRIVLASSASQAEIDHYIGLLNAGAFVSATTSADDVRHTKPAPDVFASALAKAAPLSPQEVLVVGDTPYDIEAAAKCGVATIALRSGKFGDTDLHAAGAIAIYDDVAALLACYENSPLVGLPRRGGLADEPNSLASHGAANEVVPRVGTSF